jgi:acyl carrier protein
VPGELTIGGLGVARGYLGRPALTAEKFVPDPFGAQPGGRLYRTGDLARMLPDGRLLFLGRGDHQVKVRGFRIELGEIEAQLNADPRVAQGAVVAVSEGGGEARLVAYLVPAPSLGEGAEEGAGEDFAVESLRDALRRELPEYMIPTFLIPLDSMPLNPSGKIDRRALMERKLTGGAALGAAAEYVAPRSPVEQVLANMYGDLLSVQQVGVHDNFFALGGHSLLATQLMAWIRDDFEVELPLRSLFEAPTVAGLAAVLLADPDQREAVEEVAPLLLEIAEMSEDEVAMEMEKMTDVDESGEDGGAE